MTKCFSCGCTFKPTGKGGRCIPCRRIYDREWRAKRKAEGRPVVTPKMPPEYHAAYEATYYQQPEVKARRAELARRRRENPFEQTKISARQIARNAIRRGELERQPCEVCKHPKTEAHHDNYQWPMEVRWLCRKHHREIHARAEGRT